MSTKTMKFALAAVLAVGVMSAQAEEDPIAAAAAEAAKTIAAVSQAAAAVPEESVKAIQAAEAAKNPAPTAKEMKDDAGVQAVLKMQDRPAAVQKDELPKTAEDQVKFILEKKNKIEIKRDKDRYVQVVDVDIPLTSDQAKDASFFVKRDMLSKKLLLLAKQKVAEGLGTLFSAEERNEIFGSTNELTTARVGMQIPTKPIYGVTVLAQAESWDGERYHMAAGVVWSKALEKAAKAILLGETLKSAGGDKTVNKWLADSDLALMCGPRQVVDPNGNRVFLGIAAREVGINSIADRANSRAAQISAMSHLVFSLFSDVEGASGMNSALNAYADAGGKADADAPEAVSDVVAQSVKDRMVEGANEIFTQRVPHPISGKQMFVSVYSIDSTSVAAARVRIEEMIATRVLTELANKRALGRHQGYQDQVDAAKANTEEFEKGRAEGNAAIENRVRPPKSRTSAPVAAPKKREVKSTQGVFSGEGTISNDF